MFLLCDWVGSYFMVRYARNVMRNKQKDNPMNNTMYHFAVAISVGGGGNAISRMTNRNGVTTVKTMLSLTNFSMVLSCSASMEPGSSSKFIPVRRVIHQRKPRFSESKFMQQELPACRPVLTPKMIISIWWIITMIFIPVGIALLTASRNVVEIVHRYDTDCVPKNWTTSERIAYIRSGANKTCTIELKVLKRMKSPIYVYYQLDNFLQNHRRFVKGRNDEQMRDSSKASSTIGCDHQSYVKGEPIVPCGIAAWSMFNDTYSFSRKNMTLAINRRGISWKSDRERKYGSNVFPSNFQKGPIIGGAHLDEKIPLSQQEDFIVWMRTAALPTFRKLYGKIEVDLEKNDRISVTLQNNYNSYSAHAKKKLVLSTTCLFGGKNMLGIAYLAVGGVTFVFAVIFTAGYFIKSRQLGDERLLSWNMKAGGQS
ncbi:hypothetical protein P8452_44915 [Trifolium repens]|nr:hypothetical protein P8452_44915 [Trifolium repens]